MKCPSCAARADDGAAECPACGLVFAKWRARAEKEKKEAALALAALESPTPPPPDLWVVRTVAAAVVAAWVLGLGLYVHFHPAKPHAPAQQSLRGNKTGPF
jgi:hypothetical protein